MLPQNPRQLDLEGTPNTLTVSELNREARQLLEGAFGIVRVEGEISNLSRPASGHLYFSLKDAQAQVRCAMFRNANRRVRFQVQNGSQVQVTARVGFYEARGDFQLIVEAMEEGGEGALQRKFDALKRRLAAEGLFDAATKRALPRLPARIGVITSPTGAAIRDVLTGLRRRFPTVSVLIYPTKVQGVGAAEEICEMLALADHRNDCDLLILTRGGGSLEDLWAFNEEIVARAVHAVQIPIIVGVGHETDFTIAEWVADLRAPTPSQAAELAVPDHVAWRLRQERATTQLLRGMRRMLGGRQQQNDMLERRLERCSPRLKLERYRERTVQLESALRRQLTGALAHCRVRLAHARTAVEAHNPRYRITATRALCGGWHDQLAYQMRRHIERERHRLELAERTLQSLSPLATLERGYAIVERREDRRVITGSAQLGVGTALDIRLAQGRIGARVDTLDPD